MLRNNRFSKFTSVEKFSAFWKLSIASSYEALGGSENNVAAILLSQQNQKKLVFFFYMSINPTLKTCSFSAKSRKEIIIRDYTSSTCKIEIENFYQSRYT